MKKVGVALYNDFHGSEESFLSFLQKLGVDYVEIGKEWIPPSNKVRSMEDLLDIYDLKANLHVSYHYNLAEPDRRKWKRNLLGVLGDLGICYDLNVENAVLHCGWLERDESFKDTLNEGFERFGDAFNIIQDFAGDFGLKVGLENQCSMGWQHNLFSETRLMKSSTIEGWENYLFQKTEDADRLREIIGDDIRFVLDVGHLGISHVSLEEMIKIMGDDLIGIHIHDFDEFGRDHLPLGTGKLDMDKLFTLIRNRDLFITLENRSASHIKYSIQNSPLMSLCNSI